LMQSKQFYITYMHCASYETHHQSTR